MSYSFRFDGFTPANYESLLLQLNSFGARVQGNVVTMESQGVAGTAIYNPDNQELAVTITERPFFISVSFIQMQLMASLVEKCGYAGRVTST